MNKALLNELQRQLSYPSVTVLCNTKVGTIGAPDDIRTLEMLVQEADRRLSGDVTDAVRRDTVAKLRELVNSCVAGVGTHAVAVFASPEQAAFVRLMDPVRDRVVVDNTFATRDLVVDAQRTAAFRMITVSDHICRLLVGDRVRLAEQKDDLWPLHRSEESSDAWLRIIRSAVANDQSLRDTPTVIAGTPRAARQAARVIDVNMIGIVTGNHDRTSWVGLHQEAWPLVAQYLDEADAQALMNIDTARGINRYAGGINEVWELAHEGRVELLVVERSYEFPARLQDGRLTLANDIDAPDVIDDAVDEVLESVLLKRGRVAVVADGQLSEHNRIASVLRY